MKYTAEQFPELVVRKWLQATEKKQIAIETWLKNANRGCKANVITIQGRCARVVKLLCWNQLRQFYLCSRQSGVSRVAGNVLMPCTLGEFRTQIQHWNAFSYQSVCLGPQKFSLPVRCTNSLSGSLGTWCKRPCLTALRNELAALSKSLSIFSINGRGFGIMKCWPPVKSSNRFRHTTRQVNTTLGARAQLLQPEDSATTNLEVKRFQSYLLAIHGSKQCVFYSVATVLFWNNSKITGQRQPGYWLKSVSAGMFPGIPCPSHSFEHPPAICQILAQTPW